MSVSHRLLRSKNLLCYALPLLMAGWAFGVMLWMFTQRTGYPYELEWIEGGILQQVIRVREGLSPYAEPSLDYVSALYVPLYYYVSAAFTVLFGEGLPALRIVSVSASLLTGLCVAVIVWRITCSLWGALLGLLAYSAAYLPSAYWFDLARVDSLWTSFLMLVVLSLVVHRQTGSLWSYCTTALCFVAAIFAKQASLFLAPFLFLVAWLWKDFRFAFGQALIAVILVVGFGLLLQWHSGGWFYYFTMQMATHHGMNFSMWKTFLIGDTLRMLFIPVASLLFIGMIKAPARVRAGWAVLLAGFTCMSLVSRIYPGGVENVLMPYYMLLTVMSVSFFALLVQGASGKGYIGVGIAALLLSFSYDLNRVKDAAEYQIPNLRPGGDIAIGDALVQKIRQVPGRVCSTMHGYLGYLAGKGFCAHRFFVSDLLNGGSPELIAALKAEARRKFLSGYYQVIIIDSYAEIGDLGVSVSEIPYTVTPMENDPAYPPYEFYPIVSGSKPAFWLEYNGGEYAKKP